VWDTPWGGPHSACTASKLPDARLVKAFNTIYFKSLETQSGRGGDRLAVHVAGYDESARAVVCGLVEDAGFELCGVGALEHSTIMQPGELIWTRELTVPVMRALITAR
jgi:hypothetical protein